MISLTIGESSYQNAPFAYADDFYVVKQKRGLGIGRALISAAKEEAILHRCSNILVGAGNNETYSIAFYEKNQFFDMDCKLMILPLN